MDAFWFLGEKMDASDPLCSFSKDEKGCYVSLETLKNIKFGDKSTIIKVKTPLIESTILEVDNEPEKWNTAEKFYFCNSVQDIKKASEKFIVSYYRVDGKPETATLSHLCKVSVFSI